MLKIFKEAICFVCINCGRKYFEMQIPNMPCPKCGGKLVPVDCWDENPNRDFKEPDEIEWEEEF